MNKFLIFIFFIFNCLICCAEFINDEIAQELSSTKKPKTYTNYNFENFNKIPLNLRIAENIKSEKDVFEGQIVEFRTIKTIFHKRQVLLPNNTKVVAKINTIITPGMNGIPASIIFDDFEIEGISKGQFQNNYEVFGQDRSLLVFPLKWALTFLPPTGSLTNFIKGGHAKLKTNKIIVVNYYPDWD